MPDGRTIISPAQLEHFGWKIFDRAPAITGIHPYIESTEGYRLPLESRDALLYLKLRPFTDDEWKSLPHVLASSPHPWDPSCLDARVPDDWFSQQPPTSPYQLASDYDEFGDLKPGRPLALYQTDPSVSRKDIRAYATQLVGHDIAMSRYAFAQTRAQERQARRSRTHGPSPSPTTSPSPEGEMGPDPQSVLGSSSPRRSKRLRDKKPSKPTVETIVPPDGERYDYSSDSDDDVPALTHQEHLSDSSDSDDEGMSIPRGKPAFNSRAKTATGIDFPPKSWKGTPRYEQTPEQLKRFFPGASVNTIQKSLQATTQYATRGAIQGNTLREQI